MVLRQVLWVLQLFLLQAVVVEVEVNQAHKQVLMVVLVVAVRKLKLAALVFLGKVLLVEMRLILVVMVVVVEAVLAQ
jgi:hypothetical protein